LATNHLQSIKARFGIVGSSKLLDAALETAARVAPTDLTVSITGESGVGKEVFSKIIHSLSTRKHNEFIAVNCGAIPEGTINAELFGHEKGSFTGATGDRKGYFETVNGGTIFLDEIAELPHDTQALLLRVLESGEFIRVGASKVQKTDVRVIAATNVDLQERVQKGKFREDLYYRLHTVPIKVPSLQERREDITLLFRKFAHDFAEKYRMQPIKLDERAELVLENYRWPGNIRELKNVAEQLSVLSEERLITAESLQNTMPQLFSRHLPVLPDRPGAGGKYNSEFPEREILYKVLFDMKKDLNDLKSMFYELVKSNNLRMPEVSGVRQLTPNYSATFQGTSNDFETDEYPERQDFYHNFANSERAKPIILDQGKKQDGFETGEVEDTPLAMEDIEKDAIKRALTKYKGRRKEAAEELKISERTLYRKIKEYDL
jgi:DNA-binding NtrC family response regulator